MGKRTKVIVMILLSIILVIVGVVLISYRKTHTYTLAGTERVKSEQIQPTLGTVRVESKLDTDVIFTDVETGEKYTIGYVTHGWVESVKLEKGEMVYSRG